MVEKMAPLRSSGSVDPGWEHGIAQDDRKRKVKCNYCGKVVSGGIFRFKQHLARISGQVTHCNNAPEEVYLRMKENLKGCQSTKKHRHSRDVMASLYLHSSDYDDVEDEPVDYGSKGKHVLDDKNMIVNLAPLRSLGYVDPGWEHGVAQDERKKKVKCNYCEKIVSGGINRFKQHLARIPGEVASCKNAPEEVYIKIKENMKWHRTGRRNRRPDAKDVPTFTMHSDNDEEEEQEEDPVYFRSKDKMLICDKSFGKDTRKRSRGRSPCSGAELQLKRPKLDYATMKTPKIHTPAFYKPVKTVLDRRTQKEVMSAICKFFYHAAVPLNVASSPYFYRMLELVSQYGQGLKGIYSPLICGQFLQDEITTIKQYLVEIKASGMITGCTIMADSWKDAQGKTLINFMVSCPRGMYFVSSVDVTDIVEDPSSLFKLFDKVVEEMGEENVVQVITENTAAYKAAGKMLEEKRRTLFWTPCAVYSIDRILEDFQDIKWVGECMDKGKKITKFIYNRIWLLNLMKREFTGGTEIICPSVTRFATSFVTLQSLLNHRNDLKRMFESNKWLSSRFAKLDEGKEVENIVLNSTFWKKVQYVRKSVDPVLQVLLKMDSDGSLSMASIYNDMYRAKLAIKAIHGDDVRKYGPFWNVIDNHWSSFHHPLYMAAYFLNPSYRYRPDFVEHIEATRGNNECIVRLEPDSGRRVSASMQITDFRLAKADFGTELAVSTRTEIDPAAWWQQHGINCLELQRIAIRVLSQTCSAYGCDHNWSTYDQIHSKNHNHLAQKRLNDLMYVHYNLRLKERQLIRKADSSTTLDSLLFDSLLNDWTVETEKQALLEDEIFDDEMEQPGAEEHYVYENEMGNPDMRKGLVEMLTLEDVALEVHQAADDDIDFLEDLTD
ncbi:hAT transposon superfamily [Thalictrum thalictroides]|uniref:HAT transposon superfamily n=1 Tax=Thalictrum thalictroides TaxID=46969 RepID=A0A7J6V8T1_THATH|nr:hAT transposon superfamily [Thalictrum thalictroides]